MATLEDLLAEEGFEEVKQTTKSISGRSTYWGSSPSFAKPRIGFSGPINRPVRINSDVNLQRSVSVRTVKDEFTNPGQSNTSQRSYEEKSPNRKQSKALTSLKEYTKRQGSSVKKLLDVKFKSMKIMGLTDDGFSEGIDGKLGYDRCYKNHLYEFEQKRSESQHLQGSTVFEDAKNECSVSIDDEADLKAIISMISGCVDRLLKDESFRFTVHQACISSLNISVAESNLGMDKDAIFMLKETIESVEKMITEIPNQLELKKASLKLSIFTGLKKSESEDGYTSGFPNSHLAGCAHLYLSILYKIQKKNKVSAKHLLHFFCNSPNQARTKFLPELWRCLFLPQLSHLKEWHDKEVRSILGTSEIVLKMEVLDRVYNDLLDGGTSQFAAYYKGWLMEENKGASLPSIRVPSTSFRGSPDSSNSVIPKSMISKGLYESVVGQTSRTEAAHIMVNRKEETGQSCSPKSGVYAAESFHGYNSADSQDWGVSFEENNQYDKCSCSISSSTIDMKEMKTEIEMVQLWHYGDQHEINNNEAKMKKLTQGAFQNRVIDGSDDTDTYYPLQSIDIPRYDSYPNEPIEVTYTECLNDEPDTKHILSQENSSAALALLEYHSNNDRECFTRMPKDFICPLTGLILKEPVTLESGHTFELAAIKKRFDQGFKTCPITGQPLKYSTILETNIAFKHLINDWVAECFRIYPSSIAKQVHNSKNDLAFSIFDQLLAGFSSEEKKENIRHLIDLGGLRFLTHVLESGSLAEKSSATEFLLQCIRTHGCYREYLATNARKASLLELLHCGQVHEKTNAASLLIELICLNRRVGRTHFLTGLKAEASWPIMGDLLLCLRSSLPEERVLVAALILHLDLVEEESQTRSTFSDEAVKCIIRTLECCLSNNKFIPNCRAALFMLGGHFSSSGEILTESWLLKQAGFDGYPSNYNKEGDETISVEEEVEREDWLKRLTLILLCYKRKSFIETLSKCWKLGCSELARVCLVTSALLSLALPSLSDPALSLSTSFALLPRLQESLRSESDVRCRVLACFCLFNLSKIPECMSSLKATSEEFHDPLCSLQEATWAARHLYNALLDETLS